MSTPGEAVFVDTGAWIALAIASDPFHARAKGVWTDLAVGGNRLVTSVPVVMETFTFLDRNTRREVAMTWRDQATSMRRLKIVDCTPADLTKSWSWFEVPELIRLSSVDATTFVLMRRLKIKTAFAFDQHFAQAGFGVLG